MGQEEVRSPGGESQMEEVRGMRLTINSSFSSAFLCAWTLPWLSQYSLEPPRTRNKCGEVFKGCARSVPAANSLQLTPANSNQFGGHFRLLSGRLKI